MPRYPEDIGRLIEAGYEDRLAATEWRAGIVLGVTDKVVNMVQARREDNGWCTFFHDGKCELHDKGLKPTEGKLSHHSLRLDNFNPKRALSWLIAKEWMQFNDNLESLILESLITEKNDNGTE